MTKIWLKLYSLDVRLVTLEEEEEIIQNRVGLLCRSDNGAVTDSILMSSDDVLLYARISKKELERRTL